MTNLKYVGCEIFISTLNIFEVILRSELFDLIC